MKMTLKNVRLAFPALFVAKAVNAGDKEAFGGSLILAKTDAQVKAVNEAIDAAAVAKWGAKAAAVLKQLRAGDKVCLHDGDTKAQYAGFEGNMFVSARNPARPTVINRDKSPVTEQDGIVYAGCYVNAVLEIWAQDNNYGKRVNATLMGVQFFRDGEAFSGGGVADVDDFDDLSAEEEEADDLA